MGPESRAATTARALTHKDAFVATAHNEQGVLAALSESQYNLAVVGGRIGRRSDQDRDRQKNEKCPHEFQAAPPFYSPPTGR